MNITITYIAVAFIG